MKTEETALKSEFTAGVPRPAPEVISMADVDAFDAILV